MPSALLDNLLVFGRVLRQRGVDVHLGRLLDVAGALSHIDVSSREEVRYTCRALLVHRHEQLATFDAIFDAFWRSLPGVGNRDVVDATDHAESTVRPHSSGPSRDASPPPHVRVPDTAATDGDPVDEIGMWSDAGGIAHKDFADFSDEELRAAGEAFDRLGWSPGTRRTRRWEPGRGPRVDLRRALARSQRTRGDIFTIPRSRRRLQPRPLVLLCDVSGSMERYSRLLLHFAHALGRRDRSLEVFVFSTTLTRITRELRGHSIDDALAAAAGRVPDWSGGTRIGAVLQQFHQRWARRVLHHGPVVLLVSDGWDRGDPELLRDQVARLRRSCHRLIWLNPLIGSADYAPLTRGLQAALPYVHDFLPVRTLTDLSSLADHLNALGRVPGISYGERQRTS